MDTTTLERALELARKYVAQGGLHIARQKEIIDGLERNGHDTTQAYEILETFETTQRMHIEDRNRLESELAAGR
jgi:hypothetical protein